MVEISPELRQALISVMARHEGDIGLAAQALGRGFASGRGTELAAQLRQALIALEAAESERATRQAAALRQHIQRRGAVTSTSDLEALGSPYVNAGVGSSGFTKRQGR